MRDRPSKEPPARVFATEEEFQAAVDKMIGEKLAKKERAVRRAEKRAKEAEAERDALRRELHSGGTPLRRRRRGPDDDALHDLLCDL